MFKFVLTYLLTALTLFSTAQSLDTFKISGVVLTAVDKTPIPEGTITYTRTKGTRCDSLGQFSISGLASGQHKLSFSTFGYPTIDTIVSIDKNDILDFKWIINTTCNNIFNRQKALDDIKKGQGKLLVPGGFAPVIYSTDKDFKMKYNIEYDVFGCVSPDLDECLISYNKTIFEHLDKTYGKKWRKDIRKDVIGLKHK